MNGTNITTIEYEFVILFTYLDLCTLLLLSQLDYQNQGKKSALLFSTNQSASCKPAKVNVTPAEHIIGKIKESQRRPTKCSCSIYDNYYFEIQDVSS